MRETSPWRRLTITREKRAIKDELDAAAGASSTDGVKARLRLALTRIHELNTDNTALGQLRRYIYIVSALVHQQHYGGLTAKQVQRLAEIGFAILRTQKVKPTSSRVAFVYGDLNLALSQIYRKSGEPLLSAWEQQTARHLSRRAPAANQDVAAYGSAIRALRLGHATLALQLLSSTDGGSLSDKQRLRASLVRLKALRLSGNLDAADALDQELAASDAEGLEIEWEALSRAAQRTGDLEPLVRAVGLQGRHHLGPYALEAFLWTRAVASQRWMDRLPTTRSMAESQRLRANRQGFLFKCAQAIEEAYDSDIPFVFKLRNMGHLMTGLRRLVAIDAELLVLAAVGRWLSRVHALILASITVREYHKLSFTLTDGRSRDPWGLVEDLAAKAWFVGGPTSPANATNDDNPLNTVEKTSA